jgi:hypothetical protein
LLNEKEGRKKGERERGRMLTRNFSDEASKQQGNQQTTKNKRKLKCDRKEKCGSLEKSSILVFI